jgi:hypothetical protein
MSLMSGSSPAGYAVNGQGAGEFGDFLDTVEVSEGQAERELVGEVLSGGVVGELGRNGLVGNGDAESWHVGLLIRRLTGRWLDARRRGCWRGGGHGGSGFRIGRRFRRGAGVVREQYDQDRNGQPAASVKLASRVGSSGWDIDDHGFTLGPARTARNTL